jgi:hypothetical protein
LSLASVLSSVVISASLLSVVLSTAFVTVTSCKFSSLYSVASAAVLITSSVSESFAFLPHPNTDIIIATHKKKNTIFFIKIT